VTRVTITIDDEPGEPDEPEPDEPEEKGEPALAQWGGFDDSLRLPSGF
jgi:hypothetical protein